MWPRAQTSRRHISFSSAERWGPWAKTSAQEHVCRNESKDVAQEICCSLL
jgi:hypothetical protein